MSNFSILLPAFNAQKTIKECVTSIISQSYKDWDLFLINDGSTDSTGVIIDSFKDKRIKKIHLKQNYGLVEALNYGISNIKSRFIFRMDADDVMLPHRIKKQISYITNDKTGIYSGSMVMNNKIHNIPNLNNNHIYQLLTFCNPIIHPTVLIDRNFCQNLKYDHVTCEDYYLWCKLATSGTKFKIIREPLIEYKISKFQKSIVEKHQVLIEAQKIASKYTLQNFPDQYLHLKKVGFTYARDIGMKPIIQNFLKNTYKPLWDNNIINKKYKQRLISSLAKNAFRF